MRREARRGLGRTWRRELARRSSCVRRQLDEGNVVAVGSRSKLEAQLEGVDVGEPPGQLAASKGARCPRVLRRRAPLGLRVRAISRGEVRGRPGTAGKGWA